MQCDRFRRVKFSTRVFETARPDGKRAREGDRDAAHPDHSDSEGSKRYHGGYGDPAGNVFQNSGGILNLRMTYDLRNAEKALPARVRKSIEDNRSVLA